MEVAGIDSYNKDSVLGMEDEYGDGNVHYKYKFTDYDVEDGIEYTYSVVAYDGGVPGPDIIYLPTKQQTQEVRGCSTSVL